MNTVIYGGSFDPVHNAHIEIVENLCARFDRVIVVPCRLSPFKSKTSASAAERLDMLKTALAHTTAEISTFELGSDSPNYSYLTALHFAGSGQLYWALGSEMLPSLGCWNNIDNLAATVTFYVIPRPGYRPDEKSGEAAAKYRIALADFSGGEGSSSEVKIAVAMGEAEKFLPAAVAQYVNTHGLYRDYFYVNALYAKYNLKPNRILHSFMTAICGVKLAKRLDVDTDKAATALLLHDIGKSTTVERAEELGIVLGCGVYSMPEKVRHCVIGAEILSQLEGFTDKEIIEAVRWHTTGKPAMTPLEIIVYLADFIEPLRNFQGVDKVRAATEISVMAGLREAFAQTIAYIAPEKISKDTLDAYQYYCSTSLK